MPGTGIRGDANLFGIFLVVKHRARSCPAQQGYRVLITDTTEYLQTL